MRRRAEQDKASGRWVRDPDLHAVQMGEEFVMMGVEQGEYYAVKGVAATLWRHLEEPRDLGELCTLVAAEYDVTPARLRALGEQHGHPEWVAAAELIEEYSQVLAYRSETRFDQAELLERHEQG